MERIWTAADGNCFYASITYILQRQLPQLFGDLTHQEVRRRMYEETETYRLSNPTEVIEGVDECEKDPFVNHQTLGVYANEYTMSRVAMAYNINIHVHSYCTPPRPTYVLSPQTEGDRPDVHIEHCAYGYYENRDAVNFNHFQPLIEIPAAPPPSTTAHIDSPKRRRNPNPVHDSPKERKSRPTKRKLPPPKDTSKLRHIAGMPSDKVGIQKSCQPNAGDGLFARTTLRKGDILGPYEGDHITRDQASASDSRYIMRNPRRGSDYVDAWHPASCYARYSNDPLDKKKDNCRFASAGLPPGSSEIPTIVLKATETIVEGHESYTPYEGPYWAQHHHTRTLRIRAAKRYPGYALHIENAAGEGECAHPECVAERIQHIQNQLDLHHNTDYPPPPNLKCRHSLPPADTAQETDPNNAVVSPAEVIVAPIAALISAAQPVQAQQSIAALFGATAQSQPKLVRKRRRGKWDGTGVQPITSWMEQLPTRLPQSDPDPNSQPKDAPNSGES